MIAFLGHYILVTSIVLNIICIFWYGQNRKKLYYFSTILPLIAFGLLLTAFVTSDFSVGNVFLNSSTIKPLLYKIAASWATHEGSMLLWLAMLNLIGAVALYTSNTSEQAKDYQIMLACFVQILFTCFLLATSNPFESFQLQVKQGLGLNPSLQDMALSIHPPILYLGYVSYFGTFLAAWGLLLCPKEKMGFITLCNNFSLFGLTALTSGISLGAWWAYRELGWGGYWFFDPVENISLFPWLIGIALHHFLVSKKYDQYLPWIIALGLMCFLLTIFGFFFVRSGMITSVHSFAYSAERGLYILIISSIITLLSLIGFISRIRLLISNNRETPAGIIFYGNMLWIIAFVVLLIALIYPIYYSLTFDIDIVIDQNYYFKIFIPIFIPIFLLASFAINQGKFHYIFILICSVILSLPIIYFGSSSIITKIIIAVSIFLMLSSISYLLRVSNYFKLLVTGHHIAVFLGHFAPGLLAFSIAINVIYSAQLNFNGSIGHKVENQNLFVHLKSIKFADGPNYYRQIAEFDVRDQFGQEVILKPENRLYKIENSISQESDIYSFITHDLYAVISLVKNNVVTAEIMYKPMISFIWLSLFMIALSFLLSYLVGSEKR